MAAGVIGLRHVGFRTVCAGRKLARRGLRGKVRGGRSGAVTADRRLTSVVKYDNIRSRCHRDTRPISWIKAARKDFDDFPREAQIEMGRALTILAEGRMPDVAKPLTGFGAGVMELALRHRGDAVRVIYALRIDADIWVIHAFQKKSKSGIKTPRQEIDLIHERLKRLKRLKERLA
jgi:phage-related protein